MVVTSVASVNNPVVQTGQDVGIDISGAAFFGRES